MLVVTDSFTKCLCALPTRNQQASTVAKLLWEKIVVHFGFPQRLHSTQGCDFESRIIKDLWKVAGIYVVRQEGTGKRCTLHRNLPLPYHIPHEKKPPKQTPPQRVNRCLHQPRFNQDPHLETDYSRSECEADIILITSGTTLNPSASSFASATGAEVPQERPQPTNGSIAYDMEPSAPLTDEVVAVHPQESHSSCDQAVDLHENHPHKLARPTRSGHISHPLDHLIGDPVWSQKAVVLLSLVTPTDRTVAQNVFLAWLGDT